METNGWSSARMCSPNSFNDRMALSLWKVSASFLSSSEKK